MADYPVSIDIDTFMQSADKAAMRTNMDLGTAATKDVAASGDAAAGEVVKGDDTRLTDARTPTSHTHTASEITDFDTEVANNTTVAANTSKLAGIEAGAEVNNISDVNATDLTDGGDSTLHYHSADRARANHTGTQTLSSISDAGTIASQNSNSVTITGGSVTGITDLAVADGGTGASTAAAARTNLEVYSDAEVDAELLKKVSIDQTPDKFSDESGSTGDLIEENGTLFYKTATGWKQIGILNNLPTSLLGTYSGAKGAYSLRQISGTGRGSVTETEATYSMPVVRVRRDSDNAEKSFDADEVAAGDLLSWVTATSGTANGYVSKWYDQSGTNNDAVQATAGAQPKIIDTGVFVVDGNGNKAIKFDGSDDFLGASVSISNQPLTLFGVGDMVDATTTEGALISLATSSFNEYNDIYYSTSTVYAGARSSNSLTAISSSAIAANVNLFSSILESDSSRKFYSNGALSGTNTVTLNNWTGTNIFLGKRRAGGLFAKIFVTEAILYDSDQSSNRTGIESNIATAYGITI